MRQGRWNGCTCVLVQTLKTWSDLSKTRELVNAYWRFLSSELEKYGFGGKLIQYFRLCPLYRKHGLSPESLILGQLFG